MLDRNSAIAVPDESYFIPQLADRHRGTIDVDTFVDDLRRVKTLREWDVDPEDVRERLRPGMPVGPAIAAVYEVYANRRGKARWGDKTPMYMQHLPLLERLFPDALYVHLIRDGRDAARSFLEMPEGVVTRTWAHPRSVSAFACQWRTEVESARALGGRVGDGRYLEVRYEAFVGDPERELSAICGFAGLEYEPAMLGYAGEVDLAAKPHQQSLARPPTPGLRDWRTEMAPAEVRAFEAVAGDLLVNLGYELSAPGAARPPRGRDRLRLASYAGLTAAWRGASYALRRSPLWRRRHPVLQ
jgi:hypothetical protein